MGEVISFEEWKKGNRPVSKPQPPAVVAPVEIVTADSVLPQLEALAVRLPDGREGFNGATVVRRLMQYALRDMLTFIHEKGKPPAVAVYVGVDTKHPGFVAPDWLKEQYPDEIILQIDGWWEDLVVAESAFHIRLNFFNASTPLVVPFDAVVSIFEDSTKFGMTMTNHEPAPTSPLIA